MGRQRPACGSFAFWLGYKTYKRKEITITIIPYTVLHTDTLKAGLEMGQDYLEISILSELAYPKMLL